MALSSTFATGTLLSPGAQRVFSTTPGRHGGSRTFFTPTARRTVKGTALQGKGFELDKPEKLWEIGGYDWLPFGTFESPYYLDGSLPGDRGFDPFRLAETWGSPPDGATDTPSRVRWLLEVSAWRALQWSPCLPGVGILAVELQGKGPWWTAPSAFSIMHVHPVHLEAAIPVTTFATGVVFVHVVMALLEKKRIENWQEKGEAGHFGLAPFDPVGLNNDYNRQAEVRNMRLGMLTFLGFAVQAWVTGKGPLDNAIDHLPDPFGQNIFTQGEKGLYVVAVFLAFSVALHLADAGRGRVNKRKRVSV
ncbi:hypothetical protein WJX81_007798 [Elliptochloris bilobata]|uniref:Chlorophyll a-b binding protein, chloroplastic n=1 Tax=Elliptochloris bilobata TaxID=381761 RepID=A0AAW1RMT8_9CHLO